MTNEELWLTVRPELETHLRRSHSAEEAVEIADEAFARAQGRAVTPEWLWRVAFNVEADLGRKRARRDEMEEDVATIFAGIAVPGIETAILRADFDRAFRALPREQAEAFALVELRGLTQLEAADVLGVSQPTVHRRCEAARSRLKEELR